MFARSHFPLCGPLDTIHSIYVLTVKRSTPGCFFHYSKKWIKPELWDVICCSESPTDVRVLFLCWASTEPFAGGPAIRQKSLGGTRLASLYCSLAIHHSMIPCWSRGDDAVRYGEAARSQPLGALGFVHGDKGHFKAGWGMLSFAFALRFLSGAFGPRLHLLSFPCLRPTWHDMRRRTPQTCQHNEMSPAAGRAVFTKSSSALISWVTQCSRTWKRDISKTKWGGNPAARSVLRPLSWQQTDLYYDDGSTN